MCYSEAVYSYAAGLWTLFAAVALTGLTIEYHHTDIVGGRETPRKVVGYVGLLAGSLAAAAFLADCVNAGGKANSGIGLEAGAVFILFASVAIILLGVANLKIADPSSNQVGGNETGAFFFLLLLSFF